MNNEQEKINNTNKEILGKIYTKVKLENHAGKLIVDLVMPKYKNTPKIIIWRNRYFVHEIDNKYVERFVYHHSDDMPDPKEF